MPYQLVAEEGCLAVRVAGITPRMEHHIAVDQIAEACQELGLHKVLVDLTELEIAGPLSTLDAYEFGRIIARKFADAGIRSIAQVLPKRREPREHILFVSQVASTRTAQVRQLGEMEDARPWLAAQTE